MSNRNSKASNIALASILAALAMIFSYIEALIPLNIGVPGIKLGIANLVIIIALYKLNFKYAFSINVIRIIVTGLLFTGLFGALYSLSGGTLSLIIMYLLKKTNRFSIVGVSMAGGVFHNLGQLVIAALIVATPKLFFYFPVLLFSGMLTGIGIGIFAYYLINRLNMLDRYGLKA